MDVKTLRMSLLLAVTCCHASASLSPLTSPCFSLGVRKTTHICSVSPYRGVE
ncbi:hypothetical protein E2C01_085640 [Portunus trituberculatus]|uniref:Uncharacterized protein n=1 Tax=Portunus trituberculatus TaxID=210409 RepID=A0A5B7J3A8_PORTR|nr:hypothetical protein [Portunus trituberculatus]